VPFFGIFFGKEPKFNILRRYKRIYFVGTLAKFSHCVQYCSLLLMEEIPNNHLGCRKPM